MECRKLDKNVRTKTESNYPEYRPSCDQSLYEYEVNDTEKQKEEKGFFRNFQINRDSVIMQGALEGHTGKLVAFDSHNNKVTLAFDGETFVTVSADMISQNED